MKIGIIGLGQMGGAIARGLINSAAVKPEDIVATRRNYDLLKAESDELGFGIVDDNRALVIQSDLIILAVKPYQLFPLLDVIGKRHFEDKSVLSIAAGISRQELKDYLPSTCAVMVMIPNTPIMVNQGVFTVETQRVLSEKEEDIVDLMAHLGKIYFLPDSSVGIAGTIAGCGPAFAAMIIEALGDAGVKYGLSRDQAYELAAEMLRGTAALYLERRDHPGKMKDQVCSPGGTTIRGVTALEEHGLRNALIKAIDAIEAS